MKSIKLTFVALIAVCISSQVHAQGMPDEVRKQLDRLVGTWEVKTTVGDKVVTAEGKADWAPGKECIRWSFKGEDIETGAMMASTGLIGWNSLKKIATETAFSSNGQSFFSNFTFKSDKEWTSPFRGVAATEKGEFKPSKAKRIFTWKSDDVLEIRSTERVVGAEKQTDDVVGVYTRVK